MSSSKILKKIKYAMRIIPDRAYIQMYYFAHFKKFCNLKNPKTYNEKLNWLKLHDKNPIYTRIVDKFEAKEYVKNIIGDQYIIPTLGVWDNFDDIDFDKLPQQFVLKCTHDSEGLVIVKDKDKLDKEMAKNKIESALKQNFFYIGREWPYKNVKPRIIAEKYMEDHIDGELRDYKFYCFSGKPLYCQVISDRSTNETIDFFDMNWKHMEFTGLEKPYYPHSKLEIPRPTQFFVNEKILLKNYLLISLF